METFSYICKQVNQQHSNGCKIIIQLTNCYWTYDSCNMLHITFAIWWKKFHPKSDWKQMLSVSRKISGKQNYTVNAKQLLTTIF